MRTKAESYTQLNAYFAIVPGNHRHNLRKTASPNLTFAIPVPLR